MAEAAADVRDQSPVLTGAYAATVRSTVAVLVTVNTEISALEGQLEAYFAAAEIYRSQPGLGEILGARVLGEFGDDPHCYADARARKNYAGISPVTRASGKKKIVLPRYARNDRRGDAMHQQAFCALNASSGARSHHAALRQLDEHTAWAQHLRTAA